ncbi:hypothetical protein NDU88_006637 [Pleurodeles waltl]|uniref:Uncharacterized protein n=1 Tax=Pleurodeles waltl TaxID=8319 RepID=A0AAV7LPR5_PLEWA|nr:hypothetical protein NDU88_006637 [Pleurodeles waltl]
MKAVWTYCSEFRFMPIHKSSKYPVLPEFPTIGGVLMPAMLCLTAVQSHYKAVDCLYLWSCDCEVPGWDWRKLLNAEARRSHSVAPGCLAPGADIWLPRVPQIL